MRSRRSLRITGVLSVLLPLLADALAGIAAGALTLLAVTLGKRLFK